MLLAQVGPDPAVVLFALFMAAFIGIVIWKFSQDPHKLIITPSRRKPSPPPPPSFTSVTVDVGFLMQGDPRSALMASEGMNMVTVVIPDAYPFSCSDPSIRQEEAARLWEKCGHLETFEEWENPELPAPGTYCFFVEQNGQSWEDLGSKGYSHGNPFVILAFLQACREMSFNPIEDYWIRTALRKKDGEILCFGMKKSRNNSFSISADWVWGNWKGNSINTICSAINC